MPGAAVFAVGFLALERFGGAYVAGVVTRSTALYGTIGAIFGLLAFIYVAMWLFVLSAQISQLVGEGQAPPSRVTVHELEHELHVPDLFVDVVGVVPAGIQVHLDLGTPQA